MVAAVCAIATAPAVAAPTWLGAQTVSTVGQDGAQPQVAMAADGAATAVWTSDNGVTLEVHAATRVPGGAWSAPQMLSVPGQRAYNPQVAVAADGTATALWQRNDGPHARVQVSTRPRDGAWSAAQDLSAAGQAGQEPRVAASPDGVTTVVWSRNDGSNSRVQVAVRPRDGAWGTAENLSVAGQNGSGVDVVAAADGTTTVVWNQSSGGAHRVHSATRPEGGSWSSAREVSLPAGQGNHYPQVAAADDGSLTALWSRRDGGGLRAQTATSADGISWSTPQDLSAPTVFLTGLTLRVVGDGTTAAAWTQAEGPSARIQAAVRPAGGAWSTTESLSTPGLDTPYASIVVADDGVTTAVWDRSDGGDRVETATRLPGGGWSTTQQLSTVGRSALAPQLAGGPGGTLAAAWVENEGGVRRIWVSSRPSGDGWSAPESISSGPRNATSPAIAAGGDGSFVAAWSATDGLTPTREITAATLDAAGPVLDDLVVPATGTVGQPVAVAVTPHDVWSAVGDTDWSFGDGATATGTTATHVYATPGEYAITVTSRDEHGNATRETRSITISALPPVPDVPRPPDSAPSCEARFVSLIGIEARGTQRAPTVRLTAVAARGLAGRAATILRNERPIGTTTIAADGRVVAVVAAPRSATARARARYRITVAAHGVTTSSGAHRPTRRALITGRTTLDDGRIRIQGRIAGVRRPTRLTVTGLALCGPAATADTTIRSDRRGRFTATLAAPGGATATIYRVRYGRTTVTLPTVAVRP